MFAYVFTFLLAWSSLGSAPQDKLGPLRTDFARAAVGDDLEKRAAALEALIATSEPDAADVLADEYMRVADAVRKDKGDLLSARYKLERREVVLFNLKTMAEHDERAKDLFAGEEEQIAALRKEIERLKKRLDNQEPWVEQVADGMARLFNALAPAKRKKSEQEIWRDAQEHADTLVRAAAVELVGRVGPVGTATSIHELLLESDKQIVKLRERVEKTAADVRKMEKRTQEEAEANDGRVARATGEQYDKIKQDAAEATAQIHRLEVLVDAAQRAGGIALARETGKDLEKTMAKLVGALKKSKDRSRIDTLRLLTQARSEDVRAQLRGLLSAETEPAAIATLIEGLAASGDFNVAPLLIEKYLPHDSWFVRARAAEALALLRSRDAIPALIARLGVEQGRGLSDVNHALQSLTGQTFRPTAGLWERWWKANEEGFEVLKTPPPKSMLEEAQETAGITFFGISTESQRVLFVLDLSGSMKFSMVPRNNPNDDKNKPPDLPDESKGELSRLKVAKRDLVRALSGLKDGGVFNFVLFATDVWSWSDDPETMSPEVRKRATDFIEAEDAIGGTNIYGALQRALDMAGAKSGGAWTKPVYDTIYFLTDGNASVGVSTDMEEILTLVRTRNANSGIVIHTIGLSDAHDAVLMRRLAEENGGTYVGR